MADGGAFEEHYRATLRAENERYGLPIEAPLSVLLRHIYGNRDATYAAKDMSHDRLRTLLAATMKGRIINNEFTCSDDDWRVLDQTWGSRIDTETPLFNQVITALKAG